MIPSRSWTIASTRSHRLLAGVKFSHGEYCLVQAVHDHTGSTPGKTSRVARRQWVLMLQDPLHHDRVRLFGNPDWNARHAWILAAFKDLERFLKQVISAIDGGATSKSLYPGPSGETSLVSGVEKFPETYGERHDFLKHGVRYLAYMVEDFLMTVKIAGEAKEKDQASTTNLGAAEQASNLTEQLGNLNNSSKTRAPVGSKKKNKASTKSPSTTQQTVEPTSQPSQAVDASKSRDPAGEDEPDSPAQELHTSETLVAPASSEFATSGGASASNEIASAGEEASDAPAPETRFVLTSMPAVALASEPAPQAQGHPNEASSFVLNTIPEETKPSEQTPQAQGKPPKALSFERLTEDRPRRLYSMSPDRTSAAKEAQTEPPFPGFTPTSSPTNSKFADRYTPKVSPSTSPPATPSPNQKSTDSSTPGSSSRRPQQGTTSRYPSSQSPERQHKHRDGQQDARSSERREQVRSSHRHSASPEQRDADERRPHSSRDDRPSMPKRESRRSGRHSDARGDEAGPSSGQQRRHRRQISSDQNTEEEEQDDGLRFSIKNRMKRFLG